MAKGRRPPEQQTDHAAALHDRLGRAAYKVWSDAASWDSLNDVARERWRRTAAAVLDAVTIQRRGLRGHFEVGSGYSMQRSEPYVEIAIDLSPAQFSPAKAREIGLLLLECAEVAESDAAIVAFAGTMDLDQPRAAQLLDLFRQQRERRRGGKVDAA